MPLVVPGSKTGFQSIIDTHCKLKKPRLTKSSPINNPWITDSIIDAISVKEELYNEWILSKNLRPSVQTEIQLSISILRTIKSAGTIVGGL